MIVSVDKAAELIRQGEVVAIPTETVYGLAADASNAIAIQKTFKLKERPTDNPLIVHISSADKIEDFSGLRSQDIDQLIEKFWPGPLTLVLPKKRTVLDFITAGLDSVALRMPDQKDTLDLLKLCGPLTAPSANRSGKPSPTRPQHVLDDFGEQFPVLDGGECAIGIESTVLDLTSEVPTILRPGKISADEISEILAKKVEPEPILKNQSKKSPGTRYTHYKPNATIHWMPEKNVSSFANDTLYIFHSDTIKTSESNILDFKGDYNAFAKVLYDLYRTADQKNWVKIYIQPLPEASDQPILIALKDRIERSIGNY